jgi:hypothetical protein
MSDELTIDFKWLGRQTGSPMDRAFYADIGLAAGQDWLTLLEDQEASTVTTNLRGCAYRLATWFATGGGCVGSRKHVIHDKTRTGE